MFPIFANYFVSMQLKKIIHQNIKLWKKCGLNPRIKVKFVENKGGPGNFKVDPPKKNFDLGTPMVPGRLELWFQSYERFRPIVGPLWDLKCLSIL